MGDFLAQYHLQEISHRNLRDQIDHNRKRELQTLTQHKLLKINNQQIKQKKKFVKSKNDTFNINFVNYRKPGILIIDNPHPL